MAIFEEALEKTIKHEGGYCLSMVSGDKGGETYAGISKRSNKNWEGWKLIDEWRMEKRLDGSLGEKRKEELMVLANSLYRKMHWNPLKCDLIVHQGMANVLFDYAVNAGVKTAVKALQQCLLDVGHEIDVDGIFGKQTLEALNYSETTALCNAYTLTRVRLYVDICKRDTSQRTFMLGWLTRALTYTA